MRTLLTLLMALTLVSAAAQDSASHEAQTGTVVFINISIHRTGKIQILEEGQIVTKIGQHQWAELSFPVGEHMFSPRGSDNRRVILKVNANTKQYITLDYGMSSYWPPVPDIQFHEATAIEGEHWIKEFGPEKRVNLKQQ